MFLHFLITRFNLKESSWLNTREGSSVLSNEWLENRFSLFEQYCLPSVLNQTNKNFRWLIYFDISTPQKFRSKIRDIENLSENINCYFIHGNGEFDGGIVKSISNFSTKEVKWILTTRLDNDDMIHKTFINEIQNCGVLDEPCYIDIPIGYQLCANGKGMKVRHRYNPISTFSSLYEKAEEMQQHIFSKPNFEWKDFPCKITIEKRLWVEIVHQRNLVNALNRKSALTLDCKLSDFGFDYNWTLIDTLNVYKNKLSLRLQKILKNN